MSRQRFSIFAVIFLVNLLALHFGSVAVWDGHFPLTIIIDANQPIDASQLHFATCWRESEAEYAIETGLTGEVPFRSVDSQYESHHTILVPCSGRAGPFGIAYSYQQPLFLVIQYSTLEGEDVLTRRKRINIPAGRGPRSVNVTLKE